MNEWILDYKHLHCRLLSKGKECEIIRAKHSHETKNLPKKEVIGVITG